MTTSLARKETLALMQAVARKLTGRDVVIRFAAPKSASHGRAAMYKGLDGRPVIDIHPCFEHSAELLELFTHELAHVVLHLPKMTAVNTNDPKAVFYAPSMHKDPIVMDREKEAEALADKWRKIAFLEWFNCTLYQERKFNGQLKALLKYDK